VTGEAASTPGEGKPFRPHGTEHDSKLERPMPTNVEESKVEEHEPVRETKAAEPIFEKIVQEEVK